MDLVTLPQLRFQWQSGSSGDAARHYASRMQRPAKSRFRLLLVLMTAAMVAKKHGCS